MFSFAFVLPTLAFSPGPIEITLIVVALLLLFGRRLPEVGRSLGRGLVEFKKGVKGIQDEVGQVDEEVERQRREKEKAPNVIEQRPAEPALPTTSAQPSTTPQPQPAGTEPSAAADGGSGEKQEHAAAGHS